MKKFILLLLFVSGIASSQIVNIPDANFKAKLIALGFDTNTDGEIQNSEALVVTSMDVSGSNISSLVGIESFLNLTSLNCSLNFSLSALDVSALSNLVTLDCSNFSPIIAISGSLNSLNIAGCTNLSSLKCMNNQLTSLNFSGLTQLTVLNCSNNQLTALDITGLTILYDLNISSNQIANFNFPTPLTLSAFNCSYNNLAQIDVSNVNCIEFDFSNNPNLTYINMKNGQFCNCVILLMPPLDQFCTMFLGCPNLQYICIDEGEPITVPPSINVSSYCSFTPGGNYNTITGTQVFDTNNNGCDANDLLFPNIKIKINNGTSESATFTNATGNYTLYAQAGSYTLTPYVENASFYFNFSPATAVVNFPDNNNNVSTNNFCITANGVHPDLEIVITPITPARPGFNATYRMVYKNKGNQAQSGNIVFGYNQAVLSLVSSVPNYTTIPSAGFYNYEFSNLMPFESRTIYITFHVNAPTDTPAVNIGDVLDFNAYLNSGSDETPADNAFIYHQTVVGSFDPNDITCIEGNVVPPAEIGNYLHYVINFENIGTAAAQNVVVKTTIDPAKFDVSSLQLLQTSHLVDARINGNVAEFIFNNIYLDTNGHGNVLLKIKSKNTLVTGNTVSNKADVYFDYNAPVATNIETTIFQLLGINDFELDKSVSIFPNPATSIINVNCNNSINSVELFDIQGRILYTKTVNDTQASLDISQYANGIYFVKVLTERGIKIEKVIKK